MYTALYALLYTQEAGILAKEIHIYRRGYVFWWRRQLSVMGCSSATIAISLATRDPGVAKRLGNVLNCESDVMDTSALTQAQLHEALKGVLTLHYFDFAERMHDDFDHARTLGPEERKGFLSHRFYMTRVFQGLNEVAAKFGAVVAPSFEIAKFLEDAGYSYAERKQIFARIGKRFAHEAYKEKSRIAGTPSEDHLRDCVHEQGVHPSSVHIAQCYAELAKGRAKIQARGAENYRLAQENIEAARKQLLPRLPLKYDPKNPAQPLPTYAWTDAIERGDILVKEVDGNFVVAPRGLRSVLNKIQ